MKPSPADKFGQIVPVADRLHSLAIHLLRRLRTTDESTGLTPPQLSALSVLVFRGPCTAGELAAIEQVKAPSITRIIEGLERGGLVRRRRNQEDRRVVFVLPTAKGARLLRQGRSRRVQRLAHWLERLSAEDLTIVDRAVTALEGMTHQRPC